jgi:hypothetical protein
MIFFGWNNHDSFNSANAKASRLENYCSPCRSGGGRRGLFHAYLPIIGSRTRYIQAWRSGKACKLESIKRISHIKLSGIGMGGERHEHAEDGLGAASWPQSRPATASTYCGSLHESLAML